MKRQDFIKNLKETLGERYRVTTIAPSKNSLRTDYPQYTLIVTSVSFNDIICVSNIVCKKDNSIFYIENIAIHSSSTSNDTIVSILNLNSKAVD